MEWAGVIAPSVSRSLQHHTAWSGAASHLPLPESSALLWFRRAQKLVTPPHPSDIFVSYMGILLVFNTPWGGHTQSSSQRCWRDDGTSRSCFACLHHMYVWSCRRSYNKEGFSLFLSPDQNQRERWPSFCPWILSWTQKETLRSPRTSLYGSPSVALRPACQPLPQHAALKDTYHTVQTHYYHCHHSHLSLHHCWEDGDTIPLRSWKCSAF